jgi:hypothetical protein
LPTVHYKIKGHHYSLKQKLQQQRLIILTGEAEAVAASAFLKAFYLLTNA